MITDVILPMLVTTLVELNKLKVLYYIHIYKNVA